MKLDEATQIISCDNFLYFGLSVPSKVDTVKKVCYWTTAQMNHLNSTRLLKFADVLVYKLRKNKNDYAFVPLK